MAKKTLITKRLIGIILVVSIGGFFVIDYFSCQLKTGVPMDTIDPNNFIYGDGITQNFCSITNFLDAEAIGINFDDFIIGEVENLEGLDGFGIPFDDTIDEVVVEDPNGETGFGDEGDILIDENQKEQLDILQNQTDANDPLIGDDVTDILPPEVDPAPDEITPMLVDITLLTEVTKIFTDGTEQTVTSEFQLIPLELFVEDTSNKDFSNGRFITVLKIKADPNIFVEGNGNFDIFIDNATINQSPISLSFSGTTDQNGELIIDFVSPTGATSQDFLLNIMPLTSKIKSAGITPLEFRIIDLSAKAFDVDYSINDQTVFTFDFFRDLNQIIIVDEEGQSVRAFPTDDQLSIGAVNGSVKTSRCYKHTRYSCWMTSAYYSSIGSPTIASLEVRDSNGVLIAQNLTPFTNLYVVDKLLITRNDTYTVKYGKITSPFGSAPAGSFTFTTPETQKNFKFYCTHSGSTTAVVFGTTGVDSGSLKLVCNFPS